MNRKHVGLVAAAVAVTATLIWWNWGGRARSRAVTGTIEADDAQLASRTGGRVVGVLVREGDSVGEGDVVLRLDAADVRARRAAAAAQLAEAEAGPRAEEIEAARKTLAAVEAERDFAAQDAERLRELARQKTVSDADRDAAIAKSLAMDAQAAAAAERLHELEAGTREERVEQARATLAEADALVAELDVRAPAEGHVETIHVRAGDVAAPNAPLVTFLPKGPPWVRVYVPGAWLPRVPPGTEALIRVDELPGRVFTGRVEQVNREAEFTPRNVQTPEERARQVFGVKVRLPDEPDLRPGMTAEVESNPRDAR